MLYASYIPLLSDWLITAYAITEGYQKELKEWDQFLQTLKLYCWCKWDCCYIYRAMHWL